MNPKIDKTEFKRGIEFACQLIEDLGYDKSSRHPYRISDCIRGKMNMLPKKKVRKNKHASSRSKPLTFGELAVGETFIGFPVDGDDQGHGGFRGIHYIYTKIKPNKKQKPLADNAIRTGGTYVASNFPDTMQVLKIE